MDDEFEVPAALAVLADETRLRILFALAERMGEHPDEQTMRFSELRKAIGLRDSGRFNYHLDRLRGAYIERTDDGYRLTDRGVRVVSGLSTGAYDDQPDVDPIDLDHDCPICGEPLIGRYEEGSFAVSCASDHTIKNFLPASVITERETAEVLEYFVRSTLLATEQIVAGFCGHCGGEVRQGELDDEPGPHTMFQFTCQRCGIPSTAGPNAVALVHPAVTWFMYDHGVNHREEPLETIRLALDFESDVVSVDPPRWAVTFETDAEELTLTVDENATVVDVERADR